MIWLHVLILGCLILGAGCDPSAEMPESLKSVPMADVVSIKKADFLNLSVAMLNNQYYGVFRRDIENTLSRDSYIGLVRLTDDLEPISSTDSILSQGSTSRQDARAILFQDDLLLVYNDYPKFWKWRQVFYSNIAFDAPMHLQLNAHKTEKNWVPFEYKNTLMFSYSLKPHRVLQVEDPKTGVLKEFSNCPKSLPWKEWGSPRGGTPAVLLNENEYIGFFHSYFDHNGMLWYVMGAYVFEAKPPFCLTKISQYPVMFEGAYDTPLSEAAPKDRRVLFPMGLIVEQNKIIISAGENDTSSKIIVLDRQKFLESLKKL